MNGPLDGGPPDGAPQYETGWDAFWSSTAYFAPTDANLSSCASNETTWTSSAGGNENLPINCVTWSRRTRSASGTGGSCPARPSGSSRRQEGARNACTLGGRRSWGCRVRGPGASTPFRPAITQTVRGIALVGTSRRWGSQTPERGYTASWIWQATFGSGSSIGIRARISVHVRIAPISRHSRWTPANGGFGAAPTSPSRGPCCPRTGPAAPIAPPWTRRPAATTMGSGAPELPRRIRVRLPPESTSGDR